MILNSYYKTCGQNHKLPGYLSYSSIMLSLDNNFHTDKKNIMKYVAMKKLSSDSEEVTSVVALKDQVI